MYLLFILAAVRAVPAANAEHDLWVEVRINDVPQPDFALLHVDLRRHLYVRLVDLRAWRLNVPRTATADGLVRIDDVPGLRAHLDQEHLLLRLDAAAGMFTAQVVDAGRQGRAPERGLPAVFLDYSVFAERDGAADRNYSALLQAGSSYGRASLTSSWLVSRASAALTAAPGESGWRRLDTALLLDWPEYTARLTLGDSVTLPGTLGQSVRFTGVHWGTDYATRPGLTPYALPVVTGTATVPSSVDLYVNQALVQRTPVEAGPFQLNNIPVPVGAGSVEIRMHDMLGQEQQLAVPYLVTPQLIAAGLTTTDFAAGTVREDYGIESFAYGKTFVTAGMQHGLDTTATLNTSAELLTDQVTLRGGAALRAARNVTVDLTPAVSHATGEGAGYAIATGIDTRWSATAVGVHFRDASTRYVELGNSSSGDRLRSEWAAQASTQFGYLGSMGLLYAWRRYYNAPSTAAATISYNIGLRRFGSIGVFVSDTRSGPTTDVTGGIAFTTYLGKGVTSSITAVSDNSASTVTTQVGHPAPPDAGLGWEIAHARGGTDTDGFRLDARNAYGMGSAEIDSTRFGTLGIAGWRGGFLWAGGRPWPAQSLSGPAALLVVPDVGGVEVLHDGQPVGRTDGAGRILVPGLRPFEDNTLTLVPEDVPVTALLESDRIVVRPYSHGIVSAALPVTGTLSQVFSLWLGRTEPVPAGAQVALHGHFFLVGTQGLTQLPLGDAAADALVTWVGGRCRAHVPAARRISGVETKSLDCERLP